MKVVHIAEFCIEKSLKNDCLTRSRLGVLENIASHHPSSTGSQFHQLEYIGDGVHTGFTGQGSVDERGAVHLFVGQILVTLQLL